MARAAICLAVFFLLAVISSAASDGPLTTVQQPISQVSHGATMEEKRSSPVKQDEGEEKAASKAVQAGDRRDGEPASLTSVEDQAKILEHHRGMEIKKLDNDDDGDDWDSVDDSDSDHDSDHDSDFDRGSDSDHDSDSNHDIDDDDNNDDDDDNDDEHKTNKKMNKKKKSSASGGRRVGPGGNKN